MQAMILAAGMGKRLQKYTQDQTKCMIRIAGKTLLEHACDALKAAGIHKVILVVGYHGAELGISNGSFTQILSGIDETTPIITNIKMK